MVDYYREHDLHDLPPDRDWIAEQQGLLRGYGRTDLLDDHPVRRVSPGRRIITRVGSSLRPLLAMASVIAIFTLGACSPNPSEVDRSSPSPATSPATSPAATAEADGDASSSDDGPVPAEFEVPLEAEVTYRSEALGGVTFEIDEKTAGNHPHIQTPGLLGLHISQRTGMSIRTVDKVWDPRIDKPVPAPMNLVGWLTKHPHLQVRPDGAFEVGGVRAQVLIVTARGRPPGTGCSVSVFESVSCYPIIASRALGLYVRAGDYVRVFVFDVGGRTYTAEAYGTTADKSGASAWDPVLRSLDFQN